MFNYFLIVTGILATAYVSVLKDGPAFLAAIIGALGFLTSLVFQLLDRRNRELVHLAEDILEHLERSQLFDNVVARRPDGTSFKLGLLSRETDEAEARREQLRRMRVEGGQRAERRRLDRQALADRTINRHGFLIQSTECIVAGCCLMMISTAVTLKLAADKDRVTRQQVADLISLVRQATDSNRSLQQQIGLMSLKIDQVTKSSVSPQKSIQKGMARRR